ncbi:putative enzyme related to lactoylglutathione lyase [Rhodococcus sp. OK611]|uniref:VOC family protein n=1 Tax=unclassified Rhodococcus (in: high G+C Gram-positive bacteria) TaxID=192944 RepID=UPI000BC53B06|nr:putative enzyme related to lactoylglutathione lyase [Rhodococcus sp. OK611]SNX92208.1 hypothetical protein SAMN05447004_11343 [Rhodococcus sp. OK270]
MSAVTTNQPLGTPTWIDLGIPDLDRAMSFYGQVFGWEFDIGPEEAGRYTMCLLRGKKVAALMPNPEENATEFWWNVYLATDDLDVTVARSRDAGGVVLVDPMDVMGQGRMAIVRDPSGGQFGLWQGQAHVGCELVNEPNTLLRNDLVTPDPGPARDFYAAVFDFTLDGNEDLPGMDFTFLRRPDGHEIGGIMGDPAAPACLGHAVPGHRCRRGRGRRASGGRRRGRPDRHALRADRGDHRPVRRQVHRWFPGPGRIGVGASPLPRAKAQVFAPARRSMADSVGAVQ